MDVEQDAWHDFLNRYGVPDGWHSAQLGQLAEVVGGATPSRNDARFWVGGSIPWVTPTDITKNTGRYLVSAGEAITELGASSSAVQRLPPGTVLFTSRATIGAIAIAPFEVTTNQGFASFVSKDVDGNYLYFLLKILVPVVRRLGSGTTFDEVTKRDVRRVWCSVPPAKEQMAIARVLNAADTAIEQTQKTIQAVAALADSLLHELLEEGLNRPDSCSLSRRETWPLRSVSELAEVGTGVTLGKDMSGFDSVEMPYLRVANVQDGHLDLSEIKRVSVKRSEVDNYRVLPGDVLLTEGGDLDKLGRGTLWRGEIPDCLHQNHIFRVRADNKQLLAEYFALIIESDIAKRYFLRVAKRTSNLASINKTQLRAFSFPVPPTIKEQQRIVSAVMAAKHKRQTLVEKLNALRRLKTALMQDLLTGHHRIPPEQIERLAQP